MLSTVPAFEKGTGDPKSRLAKQRLNYLLSVLKKNSGTKYFLRLEAKGKEGEELPHLSDGFGKKPGLRTGRSHQSKETQKPEHLLYEELRYTAPSGISPVSK